MTNPAPKPAANAVFFALKLLAYVANVAIAAAIGYGAWMATDYWSGIGV